jgi:hypothetical protein
VPYIKQDEPLKLECQHFVDSVRNGTTPITDGELGLEVVRILEAAGHSLRQRGAAVELETGLPVEELIAPAVNGKVAGNGHTNGNGQANGNGNGNGNGHTNGNGHAVSNGHGKATSAPDRTLIPA